MASFIETTTSQQDGSYDADGFYSLTRTFRVWGISPAQFIGDPTLIDHRDVRATPPVADKMPQYGSVLRTVSGPNPILASNGERVGIATDVVLFKWTMRPVSAVLFEAVAHYSNDPKLAPMGASYSQHSQYSIVEVPIVRKIQLIAAGQTVTTTSPWAWVESSLPAYMPVKRISQTVCILRNDRKRVEDVVDWNAGKLVYLRNLNYLVRFEGADIRSRGAQWLDVTYNFTHEMGVRNFSDLVTIDQAHLAQLQQAKQSYLIPTGGKMAFPGALEVYFLPPYHSIELVYLLPGNTTDPQPAWIYRAKGAAPQPHSYLSLPGEANFEWNLTQ